MKLILKSRIQKKQQHFWWLIFLFIYLFSAFAGKNAVALSELFERTAKNGGIAADIS